MVPDWERPASAFWTGADDNRRSWWSRLADGKKQVLENVKAKPDIEDQARRNLAATRLELLYTMRRILIELVRFTALRPRCTRRLCGPRERAHSTLVPRHVGVVTMGRKWAPVSKWRFKPLTPKLRTLSMPESAEIAKLSGITGTAP